MNYAWIESYCLAKSGVASDEKKEWNAKRFMIGGKMFAMLGGDQGGAPIFTLKLPPAFSAELRGQYEEIVPGYYMNKTHWSSLYLSGNVPNRVVESMIDRSYECLLRSFSQKMQKEIAEGQRRL